jgi:hypothetical protein
MSTVKTVERQIRRTEGFDARILHPDGRDVRGDRDHLPSYPFTKKAAGTATVADWRRARFMLRYPGFEVEVVDARGNPVHGGTLLRTVRATYR